MKMTGAKMVTESLKNEGVEVVFGYPGGAIMNVYDEIYKQSHFEHILNTIKTNPFRQQCLGGTLTKIHHLLKLWLKKQQ